MDSNFRRGTGPFTPQYGVDHRGLISLNMLLPSVVHMLSSRMFRQQLYSIILKFIAIYMNQYKNNVQIQYNKKPRNNTKLNV